MRDQEATDYYHYNWSVLLEREPSVGDKLLFGGVFAALMSVAVGGSWWYNKQLGFDSFEFFFLLLFFSVSIIGVLGYYWNNLLLRNRIGVRKYEISRNGVNVLGRKIGFDQINGDKTLENIVVEKDAAKEKRNERGFFYITLYGRKGVVQLEFVDLEMKKKVAKALRKYLNESR